jgi:hypothetical protein
LVTYGVNANGRDQDKSLEVIAAPTVVPAPRATVTLAAGPVNAIPRYERLVDTIAACCVVGAAHEDAIVNVKLNGVA